MPSSTKYFQTGNQNLMNKETNYASLYYSEISMDSEQIEKNVQDYPVSSLAHFLRLYDLKINNDARFSEMAIQTGIYLNNPYWVEFQLSDIEVEVKNKADITGGVQINSNENTGTENLDVNIEAIDNYLLVGENNNQSPDENSMANASVTIEAKTEQEDQAEKVADPIFENFTSETEVAESAGEEVVAVPEADDEGENPADGPGGETEGSIHQANQPHTADFISNALVAGQPDHAIQEEEPLEPETQYSVPPKEVSNHTEDDVITEAPFFDTDSPPAEEIISTAESGHFPAITEEEEEQSIAFEPLHTVDYFASQGIKLSEEALNDDQLGKQVKSFTAWLKSMKKLHPGQLPEQNEVIEKLIQTSSEVSNKSADVLTEAMAEVLLKQGKREKAIEMYEKLSLINPSKSAYFAAKIESLKII